MNDPAIDPETGLVKGRVSAPIPGDVQTIPDLLRRAMALYGPREALVGRYGRFTYEELGEAVASAAAALLALGIQPGDRVAGCGINDPDMVIGFLATQAIGAVWVGINPTLAGPEKLYQLSDTGARLFLADAASVAVVEAARDELPQLKQAIVMEPGDAGCEWAREISAHRTRTLPDATIDPHRPAAFAYTSGTTGKPKAVVHSQHNMLVVSLTIGKGLRGEQLARPLRHGITVPIAILNMQICDVLPALYLGGAIICIDRRDAIGVAEWVAREKVQVMRANPPTIFDLLTKPEIAELDLSSLTNLIGGGSRVSDALRERYREHFGRDITVAYGQTEAPTALTGSTIEGTKPGSVGRPYAHLEIAVLGEGNRVLPTGESGEIAVRATKQGEWAGVYTPFLGYWRQAESTRKALSGGWLHTGDLGRLDAEGNVFLQDRMNALIIRGGANVYPAEVEAAIESDPRVSGVAVVGKQDERLGEIVVAFVELKAGVDSAGIEAQLRDACLTRLAKYKVPEEWRIVPQLPRNQMNKVAKAELFHQL